MKAQLITTVLREVTRQQLTHTELAERAGLPRSAVTGYPHPGAYKKSRSIVSYGSSRRLGWNQRLNFDARREFARWFNKHVPRAAGLPVSHFKH